MAFWWAPGSFGPAKYSIFPSQQLQAGRDGVPHQATLFGVGELNDLADQLPVSLRGADVFELFDQVAPQTIVDVAVPIAGSPREVGQREAHALTVGPEKLRQPHD